MKLFTEKFIKQFSYCKRIPIHYLFRLISQRAYRTSTYQIRHIIRTTIQSKLRRRGADQCLQLRWDPRIRFVIAINTCAFFFFFFYYYY